MAEIRNWNGKAVAKTRVEAGGLGEGAGERPKRRLMRAAVLQYEANRRQGTVKTKTRGETNYTERKPYRQKGTGNARRGDRNSPLIKGGGVIFGPRPRSYRQNMPRKALREALREALRGKLADGELVALEGAAFDRPSTRAAAAALSALGVGGSAVVVTPSDQPVLWKSFRNLRRVDVRRASELNAWDVLAHDHVVLVDDAWDALCRRLAGGAADGDAGRAGAGAEEDA